MKQPTKSIQIDCELHNRLKDHCSSEGLKLQRFVENLIKNGLSKSIQPANRESKTEATGGV